MNSLLSRLSEIGFVATPTTITLENFPSFDDERFQKFLEILKEFENLEELNLWGASLNSKKIEALTGALRSPNALLSLNLGRTSIGFPEGAKVVTVANLILRLVNLKSVCLECNSIDDYSIDELARPFTKLTALEKLDLGDNDLGCRGAFILIASLKGLTALTSLQLSENKKISIDRFVLENKLNNFNVEITLDHSDNQDPFTSGDEYYCLTSYWSDANDSDEEVYSKTSRSGIYFRYETYTYDTWDWDDHKPTIEITDGVTEVDIVGTLFPTKSYWPGMRFDEVFVITTAEKIVKALQLNPFLRVLNLHRISVDEAGSAKLAETLRKYTTLHALNLYDSDIPVAGVEMIADALKSNTVLRTLILKECKIDDAGAGKIADALKGNITLETLCLQDNEIGDVGAEKMAEALKGKTVLRTLLLQGNKIGDVGAEKLKEVQKENSSLQVALEGDNRGYRQRNKNRIETMRRENIIQTFETCIRNLK